MCSVSVHVLVSVLKLGSAGECVHDAVTLLRAVFFPCFAYEGSVNS